MKKKFKTLQHNGPIFPKDYEYKGYEFDGKKLSPLAEEMLWHYAAKIETEYVKDAGFVDNFWSCLKKEVKTQKSFPADFMPLLKKMKKQQDINKELKKIEMQALSKEERKLLRESQKADRDYLKLQYGNAVLDGVAQPLGVFMIEPPGIMMARGKSPLRGLWKYRVQPEDVTINYIGPKNEVPKPPAGHKWKAVIENTNAYVTTYFDVNVGGRVTLHKKFGFGALSTVKTESDQEKFDKAQKLCKDWNKIEKWIEKGLKSKDEKTKQAALISWLILRTGIRVGGDKPEVFENFTVGASSLLVENIKVEKV